MTSVSSLRPFPLLALSLALAVGGVACGANESSGAADTTPTGATPTIDALTIESGYSSGLNAMGTRYTSAGAVITNTAAVTACGVKVEFVILDAAGAVLDTNAEALHRVAPGAALPLSSGGLGDGRPDEPASFTATIVGVDSFDPAGGCAGSSTTAQGLTLAATDSRIDTGVEIITGNLRNPTDTVAEQVVIECVLRDAFGAIIGGDSGSVRGSVAPGGDTAFDIRMLWAPAKATAAECSASA